MLKGAARLHKRRFDSYINQVGVNLVVRQPLSRTAAGDDVQKVFGTSDEHAPDESNTRTIKAVWTTDYTSMTDVDSREILDALGALALTNNDLDVVIRCKLADALPSGETNPHARTVFETAYDVVYGGLSYKVEGTVRTGLPPLGPYILWVGLRRAS